VIAITLAFTKVLRRSRVSLQLMEPEIVEETP
jgi:hypothetical protein